MCELDYLTADQLAEMDAEQVSHEHILTDVHELARLVGGLVASVAAMSAKLDGLEAEFAPLARKYSRLVSAADRLPGAGWRGRNGPPRPV